MDRRQARTRRAILGAYETLLATRRPSEITVEEILREADVGRSTFYAHFGTKDALLSEMLADVFHHVTEVDAPEEGHDFAGEEGVDSQLTHVLFHLHDQQKRLAPLFEGTSAELFWSAFRSQLLPLVERNLAHWRNDRNALMPGDLLAAHVATTFVEVARWWFARGLVQSPAEVDALFASLV